MCKIVAWLDNQIQYVIYFLFDLIVNHGLFWPPCKSSISWISWELIQTSLFEYKNLKYTTNIYIWFLKTIEGINF